MTQKLTLQINSLEALERLIGGDSEVEMDIRQSVVEAFAKKHLKTIANDATFTKVTEAIRNEGTKDLVDYVKDPNSTWGHYHWVLKDAAKAKISGFIKERVDAEVKEIISTFLEERYVKDRLNAKLNEALKYIETELTSSTLENRLNAMVNQKLKEKLGIK